MGILAAIAIPIFLNMQKNAIKASVESDVRNTVTNIATYLVENPQATVAEMNGADGVEKVISEGNFITIGGLGWQSYTVIGNSVGLGASSDGVGGDAFYFWTSAAGEYTWFTL